MNFGWRFQNARATAGPWVLFAATMGLAAWLYVGGAERGQVLGFAEAEAASVASTEVGRIAQVTVEPGQEVSAGQIVVTLDTAALDAEIALAEAEAQRIEAQIPAEEAETEQKLEESVEQIERELASAVEDQVRAKAEEKALLSERSRIKKLVDDKLAVADDLTKLEVAYSTIKPVVDDTRRIELLRKQVAAAHKRRQRAAEIRQNAELGPLEGDLLVTKRQLAQLRQKRSELVLRAPTAGKVAAVYKRAGEVVAPGEAIVSMVSTRGRVVACVPEKQALGIGMGDHARLWVRGASGAPLSGKVITIGPLVTEVSLRCRRVPTVPVWGRDVTIALDQPVDLLAGQAFDVEIDRTGSPSVPATSPATTAAPVAPAAATSSPANATEQKPALMKVPESLRRMSRFEPSGLLWRRELSRYVIASDDTGQEGAEEKQPWLFAMAEDGTVDAEPLPITGVKQVNDLESLAADDAGTIYALSSQSHSRKGKRPKTRTAFLKLSPDGRGFRASGQVHLADLLDSAGGETMARLGLSDGTRNLEIEGMAFHRGALYFGLKSPVDAQGNALIWKLNDPQALFASGQLDTAGLSLWARAHLDAEVDGKTVPGGISELLFLPDGSLVLASTSSSVEGSVESGRLWHAKQPAAGALSPRLVRAFQGLKPEGLSLAPTPGKLTIAFDAGSAVPSWVEIPWPN